MPSPRRPETLGERLSAIPPATAFAISLAIVAVAAVFFVFTSSKPSPAPTATAAASPSASPAPVSPSPSASASPSGDRSGVYVVVFNNSTDKSLGKTTASQAETIGWNVVGVGDWHGLVDSNTVYYPPKLQSQAQLLAADLGIQRIKPAFAPMQLDRLSVIMVSASH